MMVHGGGRPLDEEHEELRAEHEALVNRADWLSDEVHRLLAALTTIANDEPGQQGMPLTVHDHKDCWWRMRETARAALTGRGFSDADE